MSEIIVLDTHIWVWYINRELEKFPSSWLEIIETANQVGISTVSCYEVALAQQKGRLILPCPVDQWFQEALEPSGISLLSFLWLYNCAWRLEEGDKILAASEDERNNLEVAVHRLENLTIGRDNTDSEWGNNHIVSLPWDSNAVQQYDQVKKNTPNNYSSLTLLMQIFKNDTGKVDEWITFVKTGTLTTLFKTQANDINAGLSVSISLKDIGQLFKGKGFKDNMLQFFLELSQFSTYFNSINIGATV